VCVVGCKSFCYISCTSAYNMKSLQRLLYDPDSGDYLIMIEVYLVGNNLIRVSAYISFILENTIMV